MKKYTIMMIGILAVCFMMSTLVAAQEQQQQSEQKKFQVSDDFLNTWKKVGNMTKEIRSFKTEKAVTVAGVRGAEAEDAALKHLYFKGGVRYPNRLELLNAVEILEDYIRENPENPAIDQSKFFVGQCFIQMGDMEKGVTAFNELVDNHPESDYAALAREELEKIEKQ